MNNRFSITVPGSTSNIGAGYDTLGLALQIYLRAEISTTAEVTKIENSGEGAETLPGDESNLIYKIYRDACTVLGATPQPLHMKVTTEIPLSRGLGSSGAAVICGIAIANELNGNKLSNQQICELATRIEGHPENVTASCEGGFTVGCFADDHLFHCKIAPPEGLLAVALIPDIEISTREARELLPEFMPYSCAVSNIQRAGLLVAALANRRFDLLREGVVDRLHQPFRKHLIPGFDEILNAAYEAGAHATFLSGSGSTILAFVSGNAETVGEAMLAATNAFNYSAKVKTLELEGTGLHIERD